MNGISWRRFLPFGFYTIVALGLAAASYATETRSLGSLLGLLVLGFLIWSPFEYCLHRFAFHYDARSERMKAFVYRSHTSHHDRPNTLDDIFANLSTSIPFAATFGA